MFIALLDTCVLWPGLQRDFLLSLAAEGMYRPVWNAVILDELEYSQIKQLTGRGEEPAEAGRRAAFLVAEMRRAFQDAEVGGWERLDGSFDLPDSNVEHVLAAAVIAGAGAIVTDNIRDFPSAMVPRGLDVMTPREFAAATVELDPSRAMDAVTAIASRSGRRGVVLTEDAVLDALVRRYRMSEAVDSTRSVRNPTTEPDA